MDVPRAVPRDGEVAVDVRRLARDLLPRCGELAASATQRVLALVPELAPQGTPEEIAVVQESNDQNIGAILATLAFGVEAAPAEPPVGTLTLFRQVQEGGGDLATLLAGYRVGHDWLVRLWTDHVAAEVTDAARLHLVLRYSTEHIFDFVHRACEGLVAQYREHFAEDATAGRKRSSRHYVERLLAGQPVDLEAAGTKLGYELRGHHVGLLAAPLGDGADPRAALTRLAKAAPGAKLLAHPAGDGTWWGWLGWGTAPDPSVLAAAGEAKLNGVLVGMGEAAPAQAGFRRSHQQAVEAARTARLGPAPLPGVVRHRDVELAALLCAEPERARLLAAERLGRLATRDEATGRLRETVRVYLACGRSTARTAESLHVHQKTVSYRLARAAELLGYGVGEAPGALEAALLIDFTLYGT